MPTNPLPDDPSPGENPLAFSLAGLLVTVTIAAACFAVIANIGVSSGIMFSAIVAVAYGRTLVYVYRARRQGLEVRWEDSVWFFLGWLLIAPFLLLTGMLLGFLAACGVVLVGSLFGISGLEKTTDAGFLPLHLTLGLAGTGLLFWFCVKKDGLARPPR